MVAPRDARFIRPPRRRISHTGRRNFMRTLETGPIKRASRVVVWPPWPGMTIGKAQHWVPGLSAASLWHIMGGEFSSQVVAVRP